MTSPQDGHRQPPGGGQPDGEYQVLPPVKSRRWGRRARIGCLGFLGVIVIIVVISVIASGGGGVKTSPSGTGSATSSPSPSATSSPSASPSARASQAAGTGSYFDVSDGSGDSYRVTLVKVIDPAKPADQFSAAGNGRHLVGVVFRIRAIGGSPKNEDANNDAAIIASNGQTYTFGLSSIAGYTDFSNGSINVAEGESVTGAVAFEVPDGVKVTRVQWSPNSGFGGSTVQWSVKS